MEFRRRSLSRYVEFDVEKQEWNDTPEETCSLFYILWNDIKKLIQNMRCCVNRTSHHDHRQTDHSSLSAV